MALPKIVGTKVVVDLEIDRRAKVDAPGIVVYDPARAVWKTLALQLLGLTALSDAGQVTAVREAANALVDADDRDWTAADAQAIIKAVGTLPATGHVQVWRLPGQGMILFRAVLAEAPKAQKLSYPKGVARPSMTILQAVRPEGIVIPKGMCMEVPVKLVEVDDGLALAAYFRRATLRNATEASEEEGAAKK